MVALSVLGACEGDNLFSGDSNLAQPRAGVEGPDFVLAGDTFTVRVDGFAARGIARIDVALRGAITRDTSFTVSGGGNSVSQVFRFGAPDFFSDTLLVVSARITDVAGFSSPVKADTVDAFGPPGVISITGPDSVRAGTSVNFRVRIVGSRRITRIDLNVRGAMTLDSSINVVPPRFDVTQDITLSIPSTATDTLLRIGITARDEAGLSGVPISFNVPLSVQPPTITVTADPTSTPGGRLNVRVQASAMRQVSQIRINLRGATFIKDTTVIINPAQGSVDQTIGIPLPGTLTDPTLTVTGVAVDRAGGTSSSSSSTSTTTVTITQGAPVIVSISSVPAGADSTRGGRTYDVRVVARGVRPLTRLDVRFRGAINEDQSFTVNPAATDVDRIFSVQVPLVVGDTILTVTATATDVAGQVSTASSLSVRVRDVTGPTVSASVNPGQASAGRTVSVRVTASDNVGISRFGFAAVTNAGDTIGITPTLANTRGLSRDSVFTFTIPANLTPTQLRIIGIAFDASGLRSTSAPATLAVADSTFPTVTITDPVDNSSFPLSGQVLVRARVQDASGIRRVTYKGIAIRGDSATNRTVVPRFQEVVVNFPQPPSLSLPRDTTLVRFLTPIAGDNTSETVFIVVLAEDSLGNIASDTNRVTVGGPAVTLRNPVTGSQIQTNGTFQITADAQDAAQGLDSMKVYLTGVITDSIVVKNLNGVTTRTIDQPYTVGATTGTVNVVARAWNRQGIPGASSVATITITSTAVADTQAPQLSLTLSSATRVELDDSVVINVRAADVGTSGLARIGIVVIAQPDTLSERQDTVYREVTFAPPRSGTLDQVFLVRLADFLREGEAVNPTGQRYGENSSLRFPRRFTLEVHAFAVDASGNCGAAISATTQSRTCVLTSAIPPAPLPNTFFVAQNSVGLQTVLTTTLGSSVSLPAGGTIADALVDPRRPRLYMSNITRNKLEVLNLSTQSFESGPGSFGLVGAAPWGLSFNANFTVGGAATNDTLYVANSGGTNLSFVPLDDALPDRFQETTAKRLRTPNIVLFNVGISTGNGFIRYSINFLDFSDRPQFIGVNRDSVIMYSTVPTGAAPDGTIRYVDTHPNPADPSPLNNVPETKLLFTNGAFLPAPNGFAIAHVDSIVKCCGGVGDELVEIYDHLPGRPNTIIASGFQPIQNSLTTIRALGSDVVWQPGALFDMDAVGMSDTTFVAVTDDRTVVGFGEGATNEAGRVILCCTRNYPSGSPPPPQGLVLGVSAEVAVRDLINNANERVTGLGLNCGTLVAQCGPGAEMLGVARGSQAAYFFSRDLRLQGQFSAGVAGGAGGAALHPDHAWVNAVPAGLEYKAVSFIPTSNRTIKVVNTVHFFQTGEIPIRDNIAGPLRAVRPYAADNAGIPANSPNEVWVKLVGVTEGGRVVIVNVRRKDIGCTIAPCPAGT